MIRDLHPLFQALLGTLFTWFVTALGASIAFLPIGQFSERFQRQFLDISLGFAAGVMLAASYWSLLEPCLEIAKEYHSESFSWIPAAIGFTSGAYFVHICDWFMSKYHLDAPPSFFVDHSKKLEDDELMEEREKGEKDASIGKLRKRSSQSQFNTKSISKEEKEKNISIKRHWKRIMLLVLAITIHNFPEGLAVGVGFGAVGQNPSATFEKAKNLAIGVGIQNFPEGLAVSLPLRRAGMSAWKSFWYGQLSGLVEPIGGLIGALLVIVIRPFLPYALAFAAGAMVYVVVDDLIPEARAKGNTALASLGVIVGFNVMMILDVAFGQFFQN